MSAQIDGAGQAKSGVAHTASQDVSGEIQVLFLGPTIPLQSRITNRECLSSFLLRGHGVGHGVDQMSVSLDLQSRIKSQIVRLEGTHTPGLFLNPVLLACDGPAETQSLEQRIQTQIVIVKLTGCQDSHLPISYHHHLGLA